MVKYENIIKAIDDYCKSYSHKPHLGSLPHDRRTSDPELLQERIDAIDERVADNDKEIRKIEEKIKELTNDSAINQQNIKEAQDEIDEKTQEIEDYKDKYEETMGDALETWDEFRDQLTSGDMLLGPSYEDMPEEIDEDEWDFEEYEEDYNDEIYATSEDLNSRIDYFRDIPPEEFDVEMMNDLKTLNYDINNFMEQGFLGEDEQFIYGNLFEESTEIINDIQETRRVIDMDTEHITEQLRLQNTNEPEIKELNGRLDQLRRENQDYKEERQRTEDKKNNG